MVILVDPVLNPHIVFLFRKTVKDKLTGQDVVLTDEELDIIQKIQAGKMTVAGDPYEPYDDIFSHEVMKTSLSSRPPHKRSFIPSLLEKEKISKLVHAIKMGWITAGKPKAETPEEEEETFYALWEKEEEVRSPFPYFCYFPHLEKHRILRKNFRSERLLLRNLECKTSGGGFPIRPYCLTRNMDAGGSCSCGLCCSWKTGVTFWIQILSLAFLLYLRPDASRKARGKF